MLFLSEIFMLCLYYTVLEHDKKFVWEQALRILMLKWMFFKAPPTEIAHAHYGRSRVVRE